MDEEIVKQIVDELLASLEPLDTRTAALLQFLKAKGIATDEELTPFLEQAGKASNVRWLALRVRTAALISNAMKSEEPAAPAAPALNAQDQTSTATGQQKPAGEQANQDQSSQIQPSHDQTEKEEFKKKEAAHTETEKDKPQKKETETPPQGQDSAGNTTDRSRSSLPEKKIEEKKIEEKKVIDVKKDVKKDDKKIEPKKIEKRKEDVPAATKPSDTPPKAAKEREKENAA